MKDKSICPECGSKVIVKNGKYGEFYGCTNFPKCRFTANCEYDQEFDIDEWRHEQEWYEAEAEYDASLNG